MKKIKSYGFWVALSGAVVLVVNALGKVFGFAVEDELISDLIMSIAGFLVVLGIVTMPEKDSQEDQEPEKDEQENIDKQENLNSQEIDRQENKDENKDEN